MDMHISTPARVEVDTIQLQKMAFLYNALESGWTVKKKKEAYIFTRKHGGKKEVYLDKYLRKFMTENFDINKIAGEN